MFDTIIVGGGPAGLSAALVLGRCRRKVLVCDAGHPRNERSSAMHGFLSRDGMPPAEFLRVCKEQLGHYPCVEWREGEVATAQADGGNFSVELKDGSRETGRTLLLATGVVDDLPKIEGLDQFYGSTVHHCPYCDGWEHRDEPMAVHGGKKEAVDLAVELLLWSKDVVLCTDGDAAFSSKDSGTLERLGIRVLSEPIAALEGDGKILRGVRFRDGSFLERKAFFFSPAQCQRSPLGEQLGCDFCEEDQITCGEDASTCVKGVFAAGNASKGPQLVIIAAAEGTRAAFAINELLLKADMGC